MPVSAKESEASLDVLIYAEIHYLRPRLIFGEDGEAVSTGPDEPIRGSITLNLPKPRSFVRLSAKLIGQFIATKESESLKSHTLFERFVTTRIVMIATEVSVGKKSYLMKNGSWRLAKLYTLWTSLCPLL